MALRCIRAGRASHTHGQDACVVIKGSVAADSGRSIDFLRALARAAGRPVRGGINSPSADASFRYEGPSVVVAHRSLGGSADFVVVSGLGNVALNTTRILKPGI